jgi:hypothetical protein
MGTCSLWFLSLCPPSMPKNPCPRDKARGRKGDTEVWAIQYCRRGGLVDKGENKKPALANTHAHTIFWLYGESDIAYVQHFSELIREGV